MNKRILLIGYNFKPEPTGIGKYSGEMINWLAEKGYHCTVVTTYPYYPYWQVQEPYTKNRFWYKTEKQEFSSGGQIHIHRCPIYVPSKPSGKKRILLDLSFLISATFKIMPLILGKKFDFILTVVPSFQFGLLGIIYKKFRKAKFLYHIHDLQIEAARDLKLIKSPLVIKGLFKVERYIFRQADFISTVSERMATRINAKSQREIYLLPNWVDIDYFRPLKNKPILKQEFGLEPTDKIILYSGAIGEKQGLELLVYAAQALKERKNLKFIICGSGPYNKKLINLAQDLQLDNIQFLPLQPLDKFNKILNMADVHLVIQKSNTGDLVMPSKLTTIMAVGGLALVTANQDSELYRLITAHQMALCVEADCQVAITEGILKAVGEDWGTVSDNARKYAENHLSIGSILTDFETSILKSRA